MTFPLTNRDDALADIIVNQLVSSIREFDAPQTRPEDIQRELARVRRLMNAANWPALYQHQFFVRLRDTLTELTDAHPVTRQFLQALTLETEFN